MNCDNELLLNCHMCARSFDLHGLQFHLASEYGEDHLNSCRMCKILCESFSASNEMRLPEEEGNMEVNEAEDAYEGGEAHETEDEEPPQKVRRKEPSQDASNPLEERFPCPKCSKTYSRPFRVKQHLLTHHGSGTENLIKSPVLRIERVQVPPPQVSPLEENLYFPEHDDVKQEMITEEETAEKSDWDLSNVQYLPRDDRFQCTLCQRIYQGYHKCKEHMLHIHRISSIPSAADLIQQSLPAGVHRKREVADSGDDQDDRYDDYAPNADDDSADDDDYDSQSMMQGEKDDAPTVDSSSTSKVKYLLKEDRFACNICKRTYQRHPKCRDHMRNQHGISSIPSAAKLRHESLAGPTALDCVTSKLTSPTVDSSSTSKVKYLLKEDRFACKICKRTYQRHPNCKDHMLSHHGISSIPSAAELKLQRGTTEMDDSDDDEEEEERYDESAPNMDDSDNDDSKSMVQAEEGGPSVLDPNVLYLPEEDRYRCNLCLRTWQRHPKCRDHMLNHHGVLTIPSAAELKRQNPGKITEEMHTGDKEAEKDEDSDWQEEEEEDNKAQSNSEDDETAIDWPVTDKKTLFSTYGTVATGFTCTVCLKSYHAVSRLREHMFVVHQVKVPHTNRFKKKLRLVMKGRRPVLERVKRPVAKKKKSSDDGQAAEAKNDWPLATKFSLRTLLEAYGSKDTGFTCSEAECGRVYHSVGRLREHLFVVHQIKLPHANNIRKTLLVNVQRGKPKLLRRKRKNNGLAEQQEEEETSYYNHSGERTEDDWPLTDRATLEETYAVLPGGYRCTACPKTYLSVGRLREHMLVVHQVKVPHLHNVRKRLEVVVKGGRPKLFRKPRFGEMVEEMVEESVNEGQPEDGNLELLLMEGGSGAEVPVKEKKKRSRIITGDAIICEKCGRPFKLRTSLIRHLESYHNRPRTEIDIFKRARPFEKNGFKRLWYSCTECEKGFPRTNNLRVHMASAHGIVLPFKYKVRTNTKLRPHECELCGSSFLDRTGLTRHMKKVHKIEELKL